MNGVRFLAHVGPLGEHDLLVVIPMAVLSAVVMVIMARPRRPPTDDSEPGNPGT
jgi:hypothetical protein